MQISEKGIQFIKACEGFSSALYRDNGKWAWGYGHDQQPGEETPVSISRDEADQLLRRDLATRFEPAVNSVVAPDCTQWQFDSLCDFAYNLGTAALRTMVSHGWDQVPAQMLRWDHINGVENQGLKSRRQAEVQMFNS